MAITITATPQSYEPVYNEIVVAATSTNSAQPQFSFLFDLYINGNPIKTARFKPDETPVIAAAFQDIHRVLEDFCESRLFDIDSTQGVEPFDSSFVSYEVRIGEEYETAPDTITQFIDLETTGELYAFNGSIPEVDLNGGTDRINYDFRDYIANLSSRLLLTNMPKTRNIYEDESGYVSWLRSALGIGEKLQIQTYDASGVLIGTFRIDTNNTNVNTTQGRFMVGPCMPVSLNLVDNANFSTGVQPIITPSVAKYEVRVQSAVDADNSEVFTFHIIDNCSRHEKQTLHFINRLGGFDSKTFELMHEDSANITRSMVKTNPSRLQFDGSWSRATTDRSKKQYHTKSTTKVKLTSNWITDEESRWLLELIESPEVYLERGGIMYSVQGVTKNGYAEKTGLTGDMVNISLDIELGTDNNRQRY